MGTPIKLELESLKYDDSGVLFHNDIELNLSNKTLFSFMETDNVSLKFDFNEKEYSIFLEPYDESDYIKVTPGNKFKLSSGREELGCYFPGYFNMHITSNGELQEYLFFVKPRNLYYEDVVEIRNYVNDFYFGLSRDLLKKKKNVTGSGESNDTPNINDNTAFLSNNMP